jgi:hypothetical protein
MGRLRRQKRVVSWLATIALLSNMLAMAFLAPSTTVAFVDDALGPMIICTADGAKTAPGEGGGHPHSQHCPACTLLAPFALAVAFAAAPAIFPPPPSSRLAILQSSARAVHLSLGGNRSRAPPLSA